MTDFESRDPLELAEALLQEAQESPGEVSEADVDKLADVTSVRVQETLAKALATVAVSTGDRWAVHRLAGLAASENQLLRSVIAGGLKDISGMQTDAAKVAVPVLATFLDESPEIASHALHALRFITDDEQAAAVMPAASAVQYLDSDELLFRERAARILANAAAVDPSVVAPHVDDLVPLIERTREGLDEAAIQELSQDHGGRRQTIERREDESEESHRNAKLAAFQAIGPAASVDPDAVAEHADVLGSALTDPDYGIRREAASALGHLAEQRPAVVRAYAEDLGTIATEDGDDHARAAATWALATLADAYPEDVLSQFDGTVESVAALTDHVNPQFRGAAAGLLSYVAEEYPGQVAAHVDDLVDLLDDEPEYVRGGAVLTLTHLDDETARAALADVAENDDSESLRVTARRAIETAENSDSAEQT